MLNSGESRTGGVCAITGTLLLLVGTYLHPSEADPNNPVAAFTEYAADSLWAISHLTQFTGLALTVAALLLLAHQMELARGWAQIAKGGAIAGLAVATALQAVDGIALKVMVDTWAAASTTQKEHVFHAAFAVRQIEIGLASLLGVLFGFTVAVYGGMLLVDGTYPRWVGQLAILGGVSTMVAGIVMAFAGFSQLAMAIAMSASSLLLMWTLILGVVMWRRGSALE